MSRIVGGTAILDGSVSGQFDLDQIRETIKNLSLGVFVRTFRRHQLLQEIHHISSCHMHLVGVLSGKYTLVWLWRSLTGYVSEYSQGFRGKTAQHVLGTYVGPDMIIWKTTLYLVVDMLLRTEYKSSAAQVVSYS